MFRALKPRGIVVIVGGTGADYPRVYERLDEVARAITRSAHCAHFVRLFIVSTGTSRRRKSSSYTVPFSACCEHCSRCIGLWTNSQRSYLETFGNPVFHYAGRRSSVFGFIAPNRPPGVPSANGSRLTSRSSPTPRTGAAHRHSVRS